MPEISARGGGGGVATTIASLILPLGGMGPPKKKQVQAVLGRTG